MSNINWKTIWDKSLKDSELFPTKLIHNKTLSVSCPTRFSNIGQFTIDLTPSFKDDTLMLEMLIFNDNVSIQDLADLPKKIDDFNTLATNLIKWELDNRIVDRFEIEADGFEDEKEAINTLVDYINNKATESGRMFDDKLDELNNTIENNKPEGYNRKLNSIRSNRKFIFSKVEGILKKYYRWHSSKNEDFTDSVASFYDKNGNLAAVVTLIDDNLVIDLSKDITSKINVMQSDEEIEHEIVSDIDDAQEILANKEIEQLEEVLAGTNADRGNKHDKKDNLDGKLQDTYAAKVKSSFACPDVSYLEKLERKVTKLESLYIKSKLHH